MDLLLLVKFCIGTVATTEGDCAEKVVVIKFTVRTFACSCFLSEACVLLVPNQLSNFSWH